MSVKNVLVKIQKADRDYHLIADGDRIAVGLSGGKDSSLLLYSLHLYRQIAYGAMKKRFDVCGIHIDLNFGEEDMQPLLSFFREKGIEIYSRKSKIADILSQYLKNDKVQCSRCSQLKKGAMVRAAKEAACNKVCFGHHADDAIETLLMNMFYGAKIASFSPKMYLEREKIEFIRPFVYCEEREIIGACESLSVPRIRSGCPVDGKTKRAYVKNLLSELEKDIPGVKKNLLQALHNPEQLKIWQKNNGQ